MDAVQIDVLLFFYLPCLALPFHHHHKILRVLGRPSCAQKSPFRLFSRFALALRLYWLSNSPQMKNSLLLTWLTIEFKLLLPLLLFFLLLLILEMMSITASRNCELYHTELHASNPWPHTKPLTLTPSPLPITHNRLLYCGSCCQAASWLADDGHLQHTFHSQIPTHLIRTLCLFMSLGVLWVSVCLSLEWRTTTRVSAGPNGWILLLPLLLRLRLLLHHFTTSCNMLGRNIPIHICPAGVVKGVMMLMKIYW